MPKSFIGKRKVFDESGISYEISEILFVLPDSGRIYSLSGRADRVYVEAPGLYENRHALTSMCSKTAQTPCFERMLWPELLVQGSTGFLSPDPKLRGRPVSLANIIEDRKAKKVLALSEKQYYLSLGRQLAQILDTVHKCGYVVGTLSPAKFFVSDDGRLFSLMSYQFSFEEAEPFADPYYIAPEWLLTMNNEPVRCTQQSDAYLFATVLFQLLTGKYPFASDRQISEVDRENLWGLMSDGKSLYYWEDDAVMEAVREALWDLPVNIGPLFKRTFDYCGYGTYDEQRPSIEEWIGSL